MSEAERTIRDALRDLADGSLADCTEALLGTLGYRSDRTIDFPSVDVFLEEVGVADRLAAGQLATFEQWEDMDIVFQFTNDEVARTSDLSDGRPSPQTSSTRASHFDGGIAKSFLFLAVDLKAGRRSRSYFTASTRAVNRIFPMPTVVCFRHRDEDGEPRLTMAVIHRRLHKPRRRPGRPRARVAHQGREPGESSSRAPSVALGACVRPADPTTRGLQLRPAS